MAMTESTPVVQGQRKTKVGRVVSDKMDKTIVVSVERLTRHRLYKRVIRLTTKFKAHDEDNDAHIGDTVRIEESRPLSATKRWRLVEVVQRSGDHGAAAEFELVAEGAEVSEAIHAAAHPGRGRHDAEAADADAAAGDTDTAAADAAAGDTDTAAAAAADADAADADVAEASAAAEPDEAVEATEAAEGETAAEAVADDVPVAESEAEGPDGAAKDDKQ
jgi:small subunit ribosomal protein S17